VHNPYRVVPLLCWATVVALVAVEETKKKKKIEKIEIFFVFSTTEKANKHV
jgi:hypothetical protein